MRKKINEMKVNKNHKVRVYADGKRLKDMYQYKTGFGVFIYKVKKFFIQLFRISITLGFIILVAYIYREFNPKIVPEVQTQTIIDSSLEDKIEKMKWSLVKDIFDKERAGHIEDDGLITFDPNPKRPSVEIPSIGGCQFKVTTMQEKYLKYFGDKLTRKEAVIMSLDDDKCQAVMYHTIFKEQEGWRNWFTTCTKKVACEARLATIRELEK